jgi:hypothetical protein
MILFSDRLAFLLQVMKNEDITEIVISEEIIQTYQEQLRGHGFTAEQIHAARALGLTDEEIEFVRQERLGADPDEVSGDLMEAAADAATNLRSLGGIWIGIPSVVP